MKWLAVLLSTLVLSQAFLIPRSDRINKSKSNGVIHMSKPQRILGTKDVDLDLCPTCVDFTGQAINNLLNIILNIGVVGTCGKLCSALTNQTHSKPLGLVCNLLCDYVGVEEFVKIIEKADLDPIYFCELLTVCPIFDNGDATITSLVVKPKQGPVGTNFLVDLEFTSKNGTGTGEIILLVETVDKVPIGEAFLNKRQPPGNYGAKITVKAEPDPSCDPMQQPCENWLPGLYMVQIAICNGECGSSHPHSHVYTGGVANFTITG